MPTTYCEANNTVISLMGGVIDEFFPDIRRCEPELAISVLMADNEDNPGGALKKYGAGVVAMIKRSSKEDKAENGPDLRILIDADRWRGSSERRQRAILAHELRHVEIQWEPGGRVPQADAYGRPKIKLVADDWVLTGFEDVAEWFGEDAVEVGAVRSVYGSLQQLGLPFMAAPDQSAAVARVAEIEREADTTITLSAGGRSVTMTGERFSTMPDRIAKLPRERREPAMAAAE
jgi:hypothetical protein